MRARPVRGPLIGLTALLLAVSGCTAKPKATESDPATGDVVTNILEPEKLITTFANELQGITVIHALYKGLVDYDVKTGDPVNVVAQSITSPDSKVWTIKLKPGWKFDNGYLELWNLFEYLQGQAAQSAANIN